MNCTKTTHNRSNQRTKPRNLEKTTKSQIYRATLCGWFSHISNSFTSVYVDCFSRFLFYLLWNLITEISFECFDRFVNGDKLMKIDKSMLQVRAREWESDRDRKTIKLSFPLFFLILLDLVWVGGSLFHVKSNQIKIHLIKMLTEKRTETINQWKNVWF